jgi:hypothetical protein
MKSLGSSHGSSGADDALWDGQALPIMPLGISHGSLSLLFFCGGHFCVLYFGE